MLSEFHSIVSELKPKFGVGRLVFFGGGRWGGGGGLAPGGGGRWVGVAVRLVCCLWCFDVLLCILTKCFFRACLLCFLFSSLLSSPARWVLPASLLASLASSRFLSVWFALHRRAAVSRPVFGPCSHIVGMCSCKARRFVEALRSSWIFNFALFLFASAFLFACAFFGLVCCAPHSIGFLSGLSVRTPTSWELFRKANKWSSWSEKKVLNNLSIFELKKYSCAFS